MVSAILSLPVFLTLIVWRLVFGLQRRQSMREAAAPQRRDNNFLELEAVVAIAGDRCVNNSHGEALFERKHRAKTYLRRIVALTGARQKGTCYVLDVGKARFHVRNRYVSRIRDLNDPKCASEETCFYPVLEGMQKAEEIATALLQLKNNPALFDRWAVRNGLPFKADGELFNRPQ